MDKESKQKQKKPNGLFLLLLRLSKNLAEDVRDRAAGGVCGGQKAHRAFNQQDFETFLNVSKSAQRGENTFSTR